MTSFHEVPGKPVDTALGKFWVSCNNGASFVIRTAEGDDKVGSLGVNTHIKINSVDYNLHAHVQRVETLPPHEYALAEASGWGITYHGLSLARGEDRYNDLGFENKPTDSAIVKARNFFVIIIAEFVQTQQGKDLLTLGLRYLREYDAEALRSEITAMETKLVDARQQAMAMGKAMLAEQPEYTLARARAIDEVRDAILAAKS